MTNKILLAACVVVLIACDSRETKVQRFLLQGNEAAQKQNFQEAKHYYLEALKLDSCFSDAANNLGTVYFKEGNFTTSLSYYDKALECNPGFSQAYLNRANTFYELDQPQAALNDLGVYAKSNKDTVVLHFMRGLSLTKLRKFDEAKSAFRKAYQKDSTNTELLIDLATVFYYQHEYDSAMQLLVKAQMQKPNDPNVLNLLSLIEIDKGNLDKSMTLVNRALSLQSDNGYYLNNRGYLYLLKDSLEKAVADIDRSIGEDPYNGWSYRNKGIYYLKIKNTAEAIRLFSKALSMDSTITDINTYLAKAYMSSGDKKQACSYFKKALSKREARVKELNIICD